MQKCHLLVAYIIVCVNCFSQQYPFVHYTPKDGLVSNQVRSIYQDSKGRLYFATVNGLSVYDGARFINYTSKNGLASDIVNCVMEMGDDSVWIVPNTHKINCLVNGRMKTLSFKDPEIPVINNLYRDYKGVLYATTDQGLYFFDKDRFTKLHFTDTLGIDVNSYISYIFQVGNYLLLQRDFSVNQEFQLYLYNTETRRTIGQIRNIHSTHKAPDGRIWVSTEKNIMSVDTMEMQKGKIILRELPAIYDSIKNLGKYSIIFDREDNCWLGDQSRILKVSKDGKITSFTTATGLSMAYVNWVFRDKEGSTWIATNNAGVDKLVQSNFSFIENPLGPVSEFDLSYWEDKNQLMLYSSKNGKAVTIKDNNQLTFFHVKNANKLERLIETPKGIFGASSGGIYRIAQSGNILQPEAIRVDTGDNSFNGYLIDNNGNLLLGGKYNISAIINGKITYRKKINHYVDHAALDSKGNIWTASRNAELIMYEAQPDDPADYLKQKYIFTRELSGFSPRSITFDKDDNIWIGSRDHGIYSFRMQDGRLTERFRLTAESGLSDNFVSFLTCDADNNIWACSPAGLDKISIKNGLPVVENVTKQNRIYQTVFKVFIDRNNTAWGQTSNALIRITAEKKQPTEYSPTLMVSMIRTGKDTITEKYLSGLDHKQNNLSFYFAATSFLDEKQVQYSYQLLGGSNDQWSEPSNNASVSFVDLHPGNYTLNIKASFPAGRYPEKTIHYKFSILPPWWQSWWFKIIIGSLIVGILIIITRFYYRRKLEKQKIISEKQQLIEKERTRIATDMHDDLGAGLTRIKFITENFLEKTNDPALKSEAEKLRTSSNELVDKMGEIIWAMNDKNNTLEDLIFYLRSYAVDYCDENKLACESVISETIPQKIIGGQIRRNVFLVVKESLHNAVKHASAKKISIHFQVHDKLSITITDDGKGFEQTLIKSGNGLLNMRRRAEALHGKLSVSNGAGTTIHLEVPV